MTRTTVTFKADGFNTTQAKDYSINSCCFGDDVARWVGDRLATLIGGCLEVWRNTGSSCCPMSGPT